MTEISRRKFLKLSAASGFGCALNPTGSLLHFGQKPDLAFGLVADLHFADKEARNNRYYRESLGKLDKCVRTFNKHRLPLAIVLGDLVDSAVSHDAEQENLTAVTDLLRRFTGRLHFVLGNHDLRGFTKQGFLKRCAASTSMAYYSFDLSDCHFVVLDANFKSDGQPYNRGNFKWKDTFIPATQLQWLKEDLQKTNRSTYVFCHQNLQDETSPYGVKNADKVRRILERSGKVVAILQGHHHRGVHKSINGIDYVTLRALVDGSGMENNAFAIARINKSRRPLIQGFGKQTDVILGSEEK